MDHPVVIRTLPDQIYELLRQRIVTHDIAPGRPIRQDVVAKEAGVSKIPVREALARLEKIGLVQSAPNRGWLASPLSAQEAEDVFSLRLLIEPQTAAQASLSADQAERDRVSAAFRGMVKQTSNPAASMATRREMLLALLDQPSKPLTTKLVIELFDRSERYHAPDMPNDAFHMSSVGDLITAWLDRDGTRVETIYRQRLIRRADQARAALAD